jgi:hypothetical protein
MTRSEREYLKKRVVQHYINVANKQKKIMVNQFFRREGMLSNQIVLSSINNLVVSIINIDLVVQKNYQQDN